MKIVEMQPEVDSAACTSCMTCVKVCPVYAVSMSKENEEGKPKPSIDLSVCVGCWNCEQRCPEHAISMAPCTPFTLGTDVSRFDYQQISDLCRKAHFHPRQLVCYCTATRAEELAAAILDGARSPDQLVRATGVGAGCGIECNQPIMRFLESAGIEWERKKGSYQWYGRTMTAWEVPRQLRKDHPSFRFDSDEALFDRIIDAPVRD